MTALQHLVLESVRHLDVADSGKIRTYRLTDGGQLSFSAIAK